jgi:adenylate cyclase
LDSSCVLSWKIDGRLGRHTIEGASATLGRDPNCDIWIDRETISRRHAFFRREQGRWSVSDLGAVNGVYINGVKVEKAPLEDGDVINLGTIEFVCGLTRGHRSRTRLELSDDHPAESIAGSLSMMDLAAQLGSGLSGPQAAVEAPSIARSSIALPEGMPLLEMFQNASEALLSGQGLDSMLDRVLELVFRTLPKVERGFVCLLEGDELVPRASRSAFPSDRVQKLRLSRSVTDAAIEQREAVLVQDTRLDERFNAAESIVAMRIRSVMCAPLTHGDKVAGIVYVDTSTLGHPFTEEDLAVLSTLTMLSAVAVEQAELRQEMQKERDQRKELEKILPPHMVDQIVAGELGAEEVMRTREADISVIFADIVGFTPLSERLTAPEVTAVLNEAFERLTDVVFRHGGTLDKYIGDEIMAFFGAPRPQEDHADRAVRAALEMQRALRQLNAEKEAEEDGLQLRIGLNSGSATVGGVGHPRRLDYTAIGDVVNTAKRLEALACQPGEVVAGPGTIERLSSGFTQEPLPEIRLKGKEQPVLPARILSAPDPRPEPETPVSDPH